MKRTNEFDYTDLAEKFRTIGHPSRLNIIHLLCEALDEGMKVKTIYEKLKMDQPTTSKHLNIMRKSGIVKRIRQGSATRYSLCNDDPDVACVMKCFYHE